VIETKGPRSKTEGLSCFVAPSMALSCGCKSRRKEVILIEANRNCVRATQGLPRAPMRICVKPSLPMTHSAVDRDQIEQVSSTAK